MVKCSWSLINYDHLLIDSYFETAEAENIASVTHTSQYVFSN